METLYSLILLSPMILEKRNLTVGEEAQFRADEYLALIEKGIAKPKNKDEYEALKDEREAKQAEEEAKRVKAYAILEQEKLKESVVQLARELDDTLELIEDEEFVERFSKAKMAEVNASLIVERDDLQNRLGSIVEDIASLPLKELRAKYKREEKE